MNKDAEPQQQVRSWKIEIRRLLKDFKIPKETINKIIADTQTEAKSSDDQLALYNRAWDKAHDLIMSI